MDYLGGADKKGNAFAWTATGTGHLSATAIAIAMGVVAARCARIVPAAEASRRYGDPAGRGTEATGADLPRPRRTGQCHRSRHAAQGCARGVGLRDRDLFAAGGAVEVGQRGNPGVQAPRTGGPDLLSGRRRRAECLGYAGPQRRGVLPAGTALQARPGRQPESPSARNRSRPMRAPARTARTMPS